MGKKNINNVKLGENVQIYDFVNLYGCEIGDNTKVGTFVEIQKNAFIGGNCKIGNFSKINENVKIGDNCTIGEYTIIYDNVELGNNVIIENNCVIGAPYPDEGKLFIGDNSHIRSHSIIYNGSYFKSKLETGHHVLIRDKTLVGENLRIGSFSDIEGNCEIGDFNRFHSYVHIGRGSKIGNFVWIYSLVTLTNDPLPPSHIERPIIIDDGVVLSVNSTVLPGVYLRKGTFVGVNTVVKRNTRIGEVVVDRQNYLEGISVKDLVHMETKTRHPWMRHFFDAYPKESHNRIFKLKKEILQGR